MKTIYSLIALLISVSAFAVDINQSVKVNSIKEFFNALDDNTEIIIQCDTLNFTLENLEKELGIKETDQYWGLNDKPIKRELKSYFLSFGIILKGYQNLIIRSEKHTDIISENSYDNILSFQHCKNIVLEGVSIFHTPSTCNGSVLSISLSSNLTINNCSLNGSGGIGTKLIGAHDVRFNNVNIFNNVFYAVYAINSSNVVFEECNIYENHDWGKSVIYSDISSLKFNNCHITDNESNNLIYSSLKTVPYVTFENCEIENNPFSFNLQEYTEETFQNNYALSKEKKHEAMLQLFSLFLTHELRSDHDNRNIEFISFFNEDYKIKYKKKTYQSDFLALYFRLKQKEFFIKNYKIIDNKVILNEGNENQETWSFTFNRKNEFKKITIQ